MRPSESPEIVFLGTGAAIPSKYRNVSAILLRVPTVGTEGVGTVGTVLMDCGEGTLGQLRRRLGRRGAEDALRNLKLVRSFSVCRPFSIARELCNDPPLRRPMR